MRRARSAALLFAMACLLSATDTAVGSTLQIGSVAEIGSGALPSPISSGGFGVQLTEAAGTYSVPPGYGTVTAWSHSAGATAGVLIFKVYRPTGALREFLVVGSDTQTITAGSIQTFPVQIPVQPGDRIGLSSDGVELAFETLDAGDQIGFFGSDLPIGTTRATDGDPFPDYKLDVAATLTSDPQPSPADPPGSAGTPATGAPAAGSPSTHPAPRIAQLSLTPASFAAARTGSSTRSSRGRGFGAQVRLRVDRAATVRFSVQGVSTGRRAGRGASAGCVAATPRNRTATRCTRFVPLDGAFSKSMRAALNSSFTFTGRVGGRTLKPGSYRLIATATAGGVIGNTVRRAFRIRR